MSYCRWSDDDYQCDVYCYADVAGGYTTHVAGVRPVLDVTLPPPVPFDKGHLDAWMARHRQVMAWIEKAERRPIGLACDGETFSDDTPAEAAARLEGLREMGYCVPQSAIDALQEEAGQEE